MTAPAEPARQPRRAGRVLVVDDHAANRLLLRELLEPDGHEVVEAADGAAALELANAHPPDVVLLDVQMPGLDGFEVCRRLKAGRETAAIPVVLVTALDARDDRIAGIRAGADDFLTKPIDRTEVKLRVRNAVAAHSLFLESLTQYRKLQELEAMRDSLVHLVVHDLRSPLSVVLASLELLQLGADGLGADTAEFVADALECTRRMSDMVSDMLDVSRMEEQKLPLVLEQLDLNEVIAAAARVVAHSSVRVVHVGASMPVPARCDRKLVLRVIANLVDNAVKFSPPEGTVSVLATTTERGATVKVFDAGPGIPPEARSMIFDKFGQVRGVQQSSRSSGLGLTFCKLAVEAHGGVIGVESDGRTGSEFWFSIPPRGFE